MFSSDIFENFKNTYFEQSLSRLVSLREKYPNTESFLVQLRENTDQKKLTQWISENTSRAAIELYLKIFTF